jgi:hypothetical protein
VRLPRDVSGDDLAKALAELGHRVTRQTDFYDTTSRRTGVRARGWRGPALSAKMSETACPWKFSVEGEQGLGRSGQ